MSRWPLRVVFMLALALAPNGRADACTVVPDTSEVLPRDGATGVPRDTWITFPDSNAAPALHDASGDLPIVRSSLEGALGVVSYRPTTSLPADADVTTSDGRTFHTAADGAAPATVGTWTATGAVKVTDQGGCGGNACAGDRYYVITLHAVSPGTAPPLFNVYATGSSGSGSTPVMAFARSQPDDPSASDRTIEIHGNDNLPAVYKLMGARSLSVSAVDLAGQEGSRLDAGTYKDTGGGGCATAPGGGPGAMLPLVVLLAVMLALRGRTIAR